MTLQEFYADRFNSDPYALLDAGYDQLAALAQSAGIVWKSCADDVQLNPKGSEEKFSRYAAPRKVEATEPSLKGRVEVYSRRDVATSKDGKSRIEYPFVNFIRKGSDAGSWSGYQFLWNEYNRERQNLGLVVQNDAEMKKRREKMEAARRQREENERLSAIKAEQIKREKQQAFAAFEADFNNSPRDDGSFPYIVRKQIRDVSRCCDIRVVTRHEGVSNYKTSFLAIPLSHLNNRLGGRVAGWQRIYENGDKKLTTAINAGDFTGACHVIGDLENAHLIGVAEGFATAASAQLASQSNSNQKKRFDAVVMAVSANNMIPVIEQIIDLYPAARVVAILDNDRGKAAEGKGNTGLRTGYDIREKFPDVKCVYPTFEDDPEMKCSDFNDLHSLRGPGVVARQLDKNVLPKGCNVIERALLRLKTVAYDKGHSFEKELRKALNLAMLRCPVPHSPSDIKDMFFDTLSEMGLKNKFMPVVIKHIGRCWWRKCQVAQSARSFSERITSAKLRPPHITYSLLDSPTVTDEVVDHIKSLEGPVIFRAGMGTGKTKHALRPMMLEADRGILIAHRRSLIGGMYNTVTEGLGAKADVLHYQAEGYAAMAEYARKVTICINSTIKRCWQPLMRRHDFLGLDEATQALRAILSGKAMANPVMVFNTLIDSMARTEDRLIMVDADANDMLVEFAELVMARREKLGLPVWKQIHVVELPTEIKSLDTGEPLQVFYTDKDRIMTEVVKAVGKNEKIMLATDNAKFADNMACRLKTDFPDKKFLLVNQDNRETDEVNAFTESPATEVLKYDGLIYSPSISSGVSFETKHFDRHFGMFCGEVVPSDAIQMLRRDRKATQFIIGFGAMRGKRETDPLKIKRGIAQAMLETAAMNGDLTDVVIEKDHISCGVASSDFMEMKIRAATVEAIARNDYANNMICIMRSDGYVVAPLASDVVASEIGKELNKEAKEIVWSQNVELHMSVETPSEDEFEMLNNKRAYTSEEVAQLNRWAIENELQTTVTEESLKFYLDGGMKKVQLMEILQIDEHTAARLDREESMSTFEYSFMRNGIWENYTYSALTREQADAAFHKRHPDITNPQVKATPHVEPAARHYYRLKSSMLKTYLQDCGLDVTTLTGYATPQRQKLARDNLLKHEKREMINFLKIAGYTEEKAAPKSPFTLFKSICKSLGLRTDKRRGGREDDNHRATIRFIDPVSAEFMLGIVERRKDAGLSLHAYKAEKNEVEVDRDLDLSLYMDLKSRSKQNGINSSPASVIEDALAAVPVEIPVAWASAVLEPEELATVRTWSPHSIAMTFAGLYLTEFMDRLSARELTLLRAFMSRLRNGDGLMAV